MTSLIVEERAFAVIRESSRAVFRAVENGAGNRNTGVHVAWMCRRLLQVFAPIVLTRVFQGKILWIPHKYEIGLLTWHRGGSSLCLARSISTSGSAFAVGWPTASRYGSRPVVAAFVSI